MAPKPGHTSSPDRSGEDETRLLYDELTDDLLYDPAIGRSTMMGFPCVRLAGRFFASYDARSGRLVVKLPSRRVADLVTDGTGDEFAPAGKVFREWVAIPTADRRLWQTLLAEAAAFARSSLDRNEADPGAACRSDAECSDDEGQFQPARESARAVRRSARSLGKDVTRA